MGQPFSEIAFSFSANAVPRRFGARETNDLMVEHAGWVLTAVQPCRIIRSVGTLLLQVLLFVTCESKRRRSRPPIGPGYRG
jgi:hypothetical protein